MTILIVDGWAHRLRNDGLMESAEVLHHRFDNDSTMMAQSTLDDGWAVRPPTDVELTGGEYSTIQQTINRVASQFPEGRPGLPKSEKPTQTTVEPGAIR